ncbi:MAG: type II toxin-antitoxin system YafQ family toxin [bacterium]
MKRPAFTKQFKKDLTREKDRGKDIEKLKAIITLFVHEKQLDKKNRDHKLIGNFKNRRECHIESDWLLLYKLTEEEIIFERTGSHSDLFKK